MNLNQFGHFISSESAQDRSRNRWIALLVVGLVLSGCEKSPNSSDAALADNPEAKNPVDSGQPDPADTLRTSFKYQISGLDPIGTPCSTGVIQATNLSDACENLRDSSLNKFCNVFERTNLYLQVCEKDLPHSEPFQGAITCKVGFYKSATVPFAPYTLIPENLRGSVQYCVGALRDGTQQNLQNFDSILETPEQAGVRTKLQFTGTPNNSKADVEIQFGQFSSSGSFRNFSVYSNIQGVMSSDSAWGTLYDAETKVGDIDYYVSCQEDGFC